MVAPSLETLNPAKGGDSEAINSSQSTRRTSSRLQSNQKPQKELLVRRRVELLDDDDGNAPKKKPNVRGRVSTSVEPEPEVNGGGEVTNSVEKSDRVKVKETLRLFNKYYLHFVQEEEKRSVRAIAEKKASKKSKKGTKQPDYMALTKMIEGNEILNPSKRIGSIPGIDVGHQFYSRTEMVAVGCHSDWLNEIDCMDQNCNNEGYNNYTMPLAVAIVISGMYEDDLDNADNVTYTGQGGQNLAGDKRQIKNKKLERGNLALKNCVEQDVPVRVVRSHNCKDSYTGKIYTYDGLYKVVKYWADKDLSGFTVSKFSLKRVLGQSLFTTNQELTYDYGYSLDSVLGPDGKKGAMAIESLGADKRDGSSDSEVDQSREGQYIVAPIGSNLRDTPNKSEHVHAPTSRAQPVISRETFNNNTNGNANDCDEVEGVVCSSRSTQDKRCRKTSMIEPLFTGTTIIGMETATSQIIGRESMQTLNTFQEGVKFSGVKDHRKRCDIIKKKIIVVCTGRTSQIKDAIDYIKRRVKIRHYSLNLFKRRYFKHKASVRSCALGIFRRIKAKHSLDTQPYPSFGCIIGGRDSLWVVNVGKRPTKRDISRYVYKVRRGVCVALGSGSKWAKFYLQNRVSVDTPNEVACNLLSEALVYSAMYDCNSGGRIHVDFRRKGDEIFQEMYNAKALIAYRDKFDAVHDHLTLFALVPRVEKLRPNYVPKHGGFLASLGGILEKEIIEEACHFVAAKNKCCFHRIIFNCAYDLEYFMGKMQDFTDKINIPGKGIEGIPAGFESGLYVFPGYWMLVAHSSFELLERIIAMD